MKKTLTTFILVIFLLSLYQCKNREETDPKATVGATLAAFQFPTDSLVIEQWISANEEDSIARHAWNLWDMINTKTGIMQEGAELRAWMIWPSPEQVKNFPTTNALRGSFETKEIDLGKPLQFHGTSKAELNPAFYVSVQYNPAAAVFAHQRQYLVGDTLTSLLNNGHTTIKDFPNDAIAIKPVFYVVSQSEDYAKIPVWKGPPAEASPFPSNEWNSTVFIDLKNGSSGGSTTCDSTVVSPSPTCTYNLSDFIYYRLTKEEVKLVEQEGGQNIQEGDYAVLVGMHMSSKEIRRWTWQTFFWTPEPENPPFPSSAAIAANRNFISDTAVKNYAVALAYQMIDPVQPYTGGSINGNPVYAFNPYLEAPFDFGPGKDIQLKGYVISGNDTIVNKFGVQTNCMSCHALANFNLKNNSDNNQFYIGNTYVDMAQGKIITNLSKGEQDSVLIFLNKLKTDFLWSIPDTADE